MMRFFLFQILLLVQITAIGYMVFLVMRPLVHAIGHVGMEQQLNSTVLGVFYTMKTLMHVIGHKMLLDVRNIVSTNGSMI